MRFREFAINVIGLDKSIMYVSGAKIIRAIAELMSIIFISHYLTEIEQGFYYTFGSIIALQIFFELGLTSIITQFVASEVSFLKWDDGKLIGDDYNKSRLKSLLCFSLKWYAIIGLCFFIIVSGAGYIFFLTNSKNAAIVSWKLPWIMLVLGTSINLFLSPVIAILMGLGKVKEVSRMDFIKSIIVPVLCWIGFICQMNLYVVAFGAFVYSLIIIIYIYSTDLWGIIKTLWKIEVTAKVNYKAEIFVYQWRIALSWISGYFIYQLFNPIIFMTEGEAMAGKMGMSLAALNGINTLSLSWINTKIPLYSNLIAQKKYRELDKISSKVMIQMSSICGILLLVMLGGISLLRMENTIFKQMGIADRFLSFVPMLFMMLPLYANQFVTAWTVYLRCHKKEPFLIYYFSLSIACCLSIVLFSFKGINGITGGYCVITLLSIPWAYHIYKTKKKEWHNE